MGDWQETSPAKLLHLTSSRLQQEAASAEPHELLLLYYTALKGDVQPPTYLVQFKARVLAISCFTWDRGRNHTATRLEELPRGREEGWEPLCGVCDVREHRTSRITPR